MSLFSPLVQNLLEKLTTYCFSSYLCATSLCWRETRYCSPQATLASGSCFRWASSTASLIWSHILSGKQEKDLNIRITMCAGLFPHVTFCCMSHSSSGQSLKISDFTAPSRLVLHIIPVKSFWPIFSLSLVNAWQCDMVHCNAIRSSKHRHTVINYYTETHSNVLIFNCTSTIHTGTLYFLLHYIGYIWELKLLSLKIFLHKTYD